MSHSRSTGSSNWRHSVRNWALLFLLLLSPWSWAQQFGVVIGGPASPVGPGSVQDYSLQISNLQGQTPLTNIQLNLSLAAGLQLVNPSAIGCAQPGSVQICNVLSSVPAGGSATLNFQLRMPSSLSSPPQQVFSIVYSANADGFSAPGGTTAAIVSVARSLAVSGIATPSPVESEGVFDYVINAVLSGPNQSWDGVSITLDAPSLISLSAATAGGFNCTGSASQQICSSTIPAIGQTVRSLSIPARAGIVAISTPSTASVTSTGSFLTGGNAFIAQTIRPAAVDLSILHRYEGANVLQSGTNATFRVGVRNETVLGGPNAENVAVLYTFGAGLSLAVNSGANWSCSGTTTVLCTYTQPLLPQQLSTDLVLEANSLATVSGAIINTAAIQFPGDSNSTNNTAAASAQFAAAQLQLEKTAPSSVMLGERVDYSLVLRNSGTTDAAAVVLTDMLPPGLDLISVSGSGCNSVNPVRCVFSSLSAGATEAVTIRALTTSAGVIVNRAEAVSGDTVANAMASTSVLAGPDVSIEKAGPAQILPIPQTPIDYEVTVRNLGGSGAQQVEITDSLPPEVDFVEVSSNGWSCTNVQQLRCQLQSTLAPSASANLQIRTRLRAGISAQTITNTAEVRAVNDSDPSNNSDSAQTLVGSEALVDLKLVLSAQTPRFSSAGVSELRFTGSLSNLSATRATEIQLATSATGGQLLSLDVGSLRCTSFSNCVLSALDAGQSLPVDLRVQVDAQLSNEVRVQLSAGGVELDANPSDNQVSASATRDAGGSCCDLQLSGTAPSTAGQGEEFSVEFTLRNLSDSTAFDTRLRAELTGLTFKRATGSNCELATGSLVCLTGTIARGSVSVLRITFAGTQAGMASVDAAADFSGVDPFPANNSVRFDLGIDQINTTLITGTVAAIADPVLQQAAAAVSQVCATGSAALQAQCNAVVSAASSGNTEQVAQAVRAVLPEEILSQSTSVEQLAEVQFDNIDLRINELRAGSQGFSSNGLMLGSGRQSLALGMLNTLFGAEDEEESIGSSGELISRWGGFVNGSVTSGSQTTDQKRDFDAIGLTAGVDYRKSWKLVFGTALGFNRFESDLADDGTLSTRALTFSAYTSYNPSDRTYVDARLGFGRSSVETKRRIVIPGLVDATAKGDADVNQISVAGAFGYQWQWQGWNVTPNASVQLLRSNFAAFSETGAGDNNARFASQRSDSRQLALAVRVSKAYSFSYGVLAPQFDVSFTREFNSDGFIVDASLAGAPDVRIRTQSQVPDQSFGNAGLGLVFVSANGRQAYLSYRRLFAADRLERGTINLGARFEF